MATLATYLVFWGPIYVMMYLMIMIAGALWSPFAAVITMAIARQRGLHPYRYAAIGMAYSALFLLPWIYLVIRMYDRSVPNLLVYLVYMILYGAWILIIMGVAIFGFGPAALALFNFIVLVMSICLMACKNTPDMYKNPNTVRDQTKAIVPDFIYILPFALFLFCAAIPIVILAALAD